MIIWCLDPAEELIKKLYQKNPNRSLSGILNYVKSQQRFSIFGDYLILCKILQNSGGIELSKRQLDYAFNKSKDFQHLSVKEKKEVRQQLFENLHVAKSKKVNISRKDEK